MVSISLHTLLVLSLFVYRGEVNKTMEHLCEPTYPFAAITQTPFHSHAKVQYKLKMALPVK